MKLKKAKKSAKKPKQSLAEKWKNKKPEDLEAKKSDERKPAELAVAVPPVSVEVMLSRDQAKQLEEGIIADIKSAEGSVVAAAQKIEAFVAGKGWRALGFQGMTEWRNERMNFSLFYNARNAQKLLSAGVPAEAVEKMNLTNINTLTRKIPENKWNDPSLLKLAAGPVKEFEATVTKRSREMGMNVEDEVARGFKISVSLAETWDKALRIARVIEGCKDLETSIEAIVAAYLNGNSEVPGRTRLQLYQDSYEEKAS